MDILNDQTESGPSSPIARIAEGTGESARITGLVCIIFAAAAFGSGLVSPTPYFLFIFLSATFALLGYSEMGALGRGLLSVGLLFIAGILLILLFLLLFGSVRSGQFLFFYSLLSILIPIAVTGFALKTGRVKSWQALAPLSIPACYVIAWVSADSSVVGLGYLLVPMSWVLVGFSVYSHNRRQ